MNSLYWLWAYVGALWTTVVVQCAKPENWARCAQVDQWLVPWVRDVAEMYREGPYATEKKFVDRAK